jgi:ATP-dependent Clp protease ATP-binding subunit ClpC
MVAVFERFTDAARKVVVSAQEEARQLSHNYIGTEHVLLALLRPESGAGFRLLERLEVPGDEVRQQVLEIVGRGEETPEAHIPFTPRAKKVLEMSLREALQLRDNFIGSEHLLLGLLREGEGIGAQVLSERGVTRAAVESRLGEVEREPGPEPRPGDPLRGAGDDEPGEEMIHIPGENFARLVGEVARLRDLLRHHGIDPDEQLPPEPGIGG